MKHKVIINLPDCRIVKYQEQQRECYETWIPEVRKLGIEVIKSVSMEDLDSEYYLDGDSLFCRCTDKLDKNFTLKRYYFLKWALENREFDYVFVTSFDTFVHPLRFLNLISWHLDHPEVEASGDIWPRVGFNPWIDQVIKMDQSDYPWNLSLSGGSGFLLNRRSVSAIVENYSPEKYTQFRDFSDDEIFSYILKENGIDLWYHAKIVTGSPQNIYWDDSNGLGVPRIDQEGGHFLAAQSPLDGNMREIFNNLKTKW